MKRLAFLILTLTILFLIVPIAQAADYASLKNEYINNHPGQAIIPYPWEPSTSTRILPFNYEIPAAPSNNFSIIATRNQFEAASFIINAQKDLSKIQITVPDLYNVQGNSIPADAINVRTVKVWYQACADNIRCTNVGYYLTPELLLKDDSLVKVDYATKTNYLKVTIYSVEQYIDISNPASTFPSNAQIHDASSLQPFSLKANENKQIWLTVHVPDNTPAGDYYGNITITAPAEVPVVMNFSVRVLPFDLEPAPIEYGIYYNSKLSYGSQYERTPVQMTVELQDIKEHGVLYPSAILYDDADLETALTIRDAVGFPKDKIYLHDVEVKYGAHSAYIGNSSNPADLTSLAKNVTFWTDYTKTHGYIDTYFYGMDEVDDATLLSERTAWQTVHNNGGKIWVANDYKNIDLVADLLDLVVQGPTLNTTRATLFHSYGNRIVSYNNPLAGVENPEIYRKNYGFVLWNAGYDGAMNFAYQAKFGPSIWNDYDTASDSSYYRDHVFAYPTSDGVIDTIQWEGWREGVDDTRYVATLIKKEVGVTSANAIITSSLSQGNDMTTIRERIIEQILILPIPPTAQFTTNITYGKVLFPEHFSDQSVSAGTTIFNWNINNDEERAYTTKNAIHTYQTAENYTVNLTVTKGQQNFRSLVQPVLFKISSKISKMF
jgi:PKD repeat protein